MIRFSHVSHSGFGVGRGLRDISLHVARGEMGAIVGHAGTGKGLIMRMCTLQLEPEEGKVILDGIDTRDLSRREHRHLRLSTGVISPDLPLLSDRSVLENVSLAMEVRGWSGRRAVRSALKAMERVGILELKSAFPGEIPECERALACLARAIAFRPSMVLAYRILESLPGEPSTRALRVLRDMAALGAAVMLIDTSMDSSEPSGWRLYSLSEGTIKRIETTARPDRVGRRTSLVDRLLDSTT